MRLYDHRAFVHLSACDICLSARLSVCPTLDPQQQTCCRFAAVGWLAGDIDRLLHGAQERGGRRANATLSAYAGSLTQTC